MINPYKRAAAILSAIAILIIAVLRIPAIKGSNFDDFLKGCAVGAGLVGIAVITATFVQGLRTKMKTIR